MRARGLVIAGMATGALVGLLLSVLTRIPLGVDPEGHACHCMSWWWAALLTAVFIPLVAAFSSRLMAMKWTCYKPPMLQLVPVAFLTFVMPVLGPVFGGHGGFTEIPIVTLMGAVGGLFWSMPYILWVGFLPRSRRNNDNHIR